jgi:hypothetical protein
VSCTCLGSLVKGTTNNIVACHSWVAQGAKVSKNDGRGLLTISDVSALKLRQGKFSFKRCPVREDGKTTINITLLNQPR